ncbi:MAG: alginate export family protein [Candidatus Hydrogenedentota bacterium]
MRTFKIAVIAALMVGLSFGAYAELQNVLVNGSIRIRGNYYDADSAAISGTAGWVEQRTRLGVQADFTDNVSAFIELDSYDNWGEDFRSNYVTGVDSRANSVDDVEIYQAYIDATEMWDTPVYMRIGRQEVLLGSEWLVGNKDTAAFYSGLSFDGVVAGYGTDMVDVKAMWLKLNENFGDFSDDDVDLYGVYGSYLGLEDIVLDAYWLFVNDDTLDNDLHTLGLRGAGALGAFDFEAEAAYQFGDRGAGDYDAFGGNFQVGYTFDMTWQPRPFLGFAYFEGADGDDAAFNRLFSDWEYTEFWADGEESNLFVYQAGLGVQPTEAIGLDLLGSYYQADEDNGDDDLGFELGLYASYAYSEDLTFRAGYAHFFGSDGLEDGNPVQLNGTNAFLADGNDDGDYLFFETEIAF